MLIDPERSNRTADQIALSVGYSVLFFVALTLACRNIGLQNAALRDLKNESRSIASKNNSIAITEKIDGTKLAVNRTVASMPTISRNARPIGFSIRAGARP